MDTIFCILSSAHIRKSNRPSPRQQWKDRHLLVRCSQLFLAWIEAVKHLKLLSDNTEKNGTFIPPPLSTANQQTIFSSTFVCQAAFFFFVWKADEQVNECPVATGQRATCQQLELSGSRMVRVWGALITQTQRVFKLQSLFYVWWQRVPMIRHCSQANSRLNTPVKELPNPWAWNFYLPAHCSLVGSPTWASGK